ncbi:MAG: hypothetical protein MZV63_64920 [Marinilabiliales bacterium]|nr:hypothetical protein [Marinilabiliales bacterium]
MRTVPLAKTVVPALAALGALVPALLAAAGLLAASACGTYSSSASSVRSTPTSCPRSGTS